MAKTIVGLYDHFDDAQQVVKELISSGFSRNDISLVVNDAEDQYARYSDTEAEVATSSGSSAATGAGVGAAIGGIGGLVIGLTALAIPGIGPIVAAGPLATALVGAGVGAAAGGLIGALSNLGVPEEEAGYYAEGVRRGGALVTVKTSDDLADRASDIMNRYNPLDVEERSAQWRQEGWSRFDPDAEAYTSAEVLSERERYRKLDGETGETTIPVVEETVTVDKREIEKGRVRIRSYIEEQPVEEEVSLRQESVTVERNPVDRPATEADLEAARDEVIEVTETAEEAVVAKQARVVEEVVVQKEVAEHTETVRETVRHTEVEVEEVGARQMTEVQDYDVYDPQFRQHYTSTLANRGGAYDDYEPAYRYGYTLATEPRYRDRDWTVLKSDAQRDWEVQHPGTWERMKDAVYHGWQQVRGRS